MPNFAKVVLWHFTSMIFRVSCKLPYQALNSFHFPVMCSLRTPRPICRSTYRPTYRSTCRSTYRSRLRRHLDRYVSRAVLVEHRSICRPICRPVCRPLCRPMLDRYFGRYSGRHSADFLSVEYRSSVGGLSVDCLII